MIKDCERVSLEIGEWIRTKIEEAGATTAVVGLSGGADSALVALICNKSNIPLVCVKMPCQSSKESLARADELSEKFGLRTIQVNLDEAFAQIQVQVKYELETVSTTQQDGSLRSCLRAPTLDFVAKMTNGLIVGTGNRDEDELTRYYNKRGDGAVDIAPIAKLHKSEVYQLLWHLDCPASILDATPSADLWGPDSGQADEKELGITYDEIEWAIQQEDAFGIITGRGYGLLLEDYMKFSPRQLEILQRVAKMEKISRHKASMPPVWDMRADPVLFDDENPY